MIIGSSHVGRENDDERLKYGGTTMDAVLYLDDLKTGEHHEHPIPNYSMRCIEHRITYDLYTVFTLHL